MQKKKVFFGGWADLGVAVSFLKDTLSFAFNIFELTGPHRPGQQPHHPQGQQHGNRDQQEKYVHQSLSLTRVRRAALAITSRELSAMPRPASQAGR